MAFYDPSTAKYLDPKTDRRVAVVTGGNSGIGWYTVLHLYLHGYTVYVAGRNDEKVATAIAEIQQEAEKRTAAYTDKEREARPLGSLDSLRLDCCDLESVKSCAETLIKKEPVANLLINNAGVMAVPHEITKDGFEIQYQVNTVAPALLALLLVPVLKKAKDNTLPRAITLSSMGHQFSWRYFTPGDTLQRFPESWFCWIRYGNAKRAAIEFTARFAREYPDILAFSVHPGVIYGTRLYDSWISGSVLAPVLNLCKSVLGSVVGVTCEEGSLATLRAALDESLTPADSGSYLVTGGPKAEPLKVAADKANQETTWEYNRLELAKRGLLQL